MVRLEHILPAASGRAVDARRLDAFLTAHPQVDQLVLGWANTFYTRFEGRIEGRAQVLRVLGAQVTALLALATPLAARLRNALPDPAAGLLFADALGAAAAARLLAEANREVDPDVVSLLALLRGLGPALALIGDTEAQLRWWREVRRSRGKARSESLAELFGADPSCQVGTIALELGAEPELATAIAGLDRDAFSASCAPTLTRAHRLVEALGAADSATALQSWLSESGLPPEGARALIDEVLRLAPRLARLLDLPFHPWPKRSVLEHRSGSADQVTEPGELSLLVGLQEALIHDLRARTTRAEIQRAERLRVDPLTELSTFQAFVSDLTEAMTGSDPQVRTLVALDLVGFADLFVQEGLQASDEVLSATARTLRRLFPDAPLMARCGPATFLVGLSASGREVRFVAERARHALGERFTQDPRVEVQASSLSLDALPPGADGPAVIEAARRALGPSERRRRRRSRAG